MGNNLIGTNGSYQRINSNTNQQEETDGD